MDLYPDALPAEAELPRMSVKFAFAKEKEPGLELADVSTLPDDEVVIGDKIARVCYGLRRSACLRPARTYDEGERKRWREAILGRDCLEGPEEEDYIGASKTLTVDRSKLVAFDWRRSGMRSADRRAPQYVPTNHDELYR
jgi:hypothetical protein